MFFIILWWIKLQLQIANLIVRNIFYKKVHWNASFDKSFTQPWNKPLKESGVICFFVQNSAEFFEHRTILQKIFWSNQRICDSRIWAYISHLRSSLANVADIRLVCFWLIGIRLCMSSRTMDVQWSLFSLKSRTFGLGQKNWTDNSLLYFWSSTKYYLEVCSNIKNVRNPRNVSAHFFITRVEPNKTKNECFWLNFCLHNVVFYWLHHSEILRRFTDFPAAKWFLFSSQSAILLFQVILFVTSKLFQK